MVPGRRDTVAMADPADQTILTLKPSNACTVTCPDAFPQPAVGSRALNSSTPTSHQPRTDRSWESCNYLNSRRDPQGDWAPCHTCNFSITHTSLLTSFPTKHNSWVISQRDRPHILISVCFCGLLTKDTVGNRQWSKSSPPLHLPQVLSLISLFNSETLLANNT